MRLISPTVSGRSRVAVRVVALLLPLLILLPLLSQPAFAQTTYVITDGDQVKVYTTFETNPAEVLNEAGIDLDVDDAYTTQPGEGVAEITVKRNQRITINNCGQILQANSYGETLDSLFTRLGIPTYGSYKVSLPLDTQTYDGLEVEVNSVIEMEQTYTEEIPYNTTYCNDPGLPVGQEQVIVEGAAGQMRNVANVVYVNTKEQSRTVLSQTVVQQPVDRIVAVGTGEEGNLDPNAPAIGDGVIVTASGEILTYSRKEQYKATAYTHFDEGCNMITATGTTVHIGTVAVDPTVIPYGTRMFIVSNDGQYVYGLSTAEDCGGAIKGNRLDLYYPTLAEAFQFGIRNCTVYFLD